MTDLQALYAGICAEPDEDTPRLALADFLDEQGGKENEFRADLIRTHCRLAREEPWSEPWRELNDRWRAISTSTTMLAQKDWPSWLIHLKGRVRAWAFERGLVGHLTLFSKRFVSEGNAYFEQDPVRSVKFVTLASTMGSVKPDVLFACEYLARIAKLDFDGSELKDGELLKLAASPHVKGVRWLGLGGYNSFSSAAVPKLLRAMPELTELSFVDNRWFADEHVTSLAKCPEFARVATLDLDSCGVSAKGVAALVSGKHAAPLAVLRLTPELDYDDIGSARGHGVDRADGLAVAEALAGAKSLGTLRELNLSYRDIGPDGLRLIAGAAKSLPALRELHLPGNGLTLAAVTDLAKSALGPRLLYLNLQYNPHLGRHAKQLAALFPAAHVVEPFEHVP